MLLNDTTLHPLPANRADDYRYEHSFNWSPKQIQGQAMCHDMPANSKRPITAWPADLLSRDTSIFQSAPGADLEVSRIN